MSEEPPEVAEARRQVRAWEHERYVEREAAEETKRQAWVAEHIGHRYEVEIDAVERYGDDSYSVSFTAQLLKADRNEGEMEWDNGVTTSGVYLSDWLPDD